MVVIMSSYCNGCHFLNRGVMSACSICRHMILRFSAARCINCMHNSGTRSSYSSATAARPLAATLQAVPSSDTSTNSLPPATRQSSSCSSTTSSARRPPKAPATAATVIGSDSANSSSSVRHRKSSSASGSVKATGSSSGSSSSSNGAVGQHGRRSSSTAYHSDVNQALRGVEADMLTSYTRRYAIDTALLAFNYQT
jgi:hypothetical protein